jgi:hypothetical protein
MLRIGYHSAAVGAAIPDSRKVGIERVVLTLKVSLMLADAAHAVGGKLYILGGGWSVLTGPAAYAIVLKIDVPWSDATDTHNLRLELLDADGQPVLGPDGETPMATIEGTVSTGIPAGVKRGTPLDAVTAIPVPPLPLEPGRYEWRLTINGKGHEDWRLPFTRANPPALPPAVELAA